MPKNKNMTTYAILLIALVAGFGFLTNWTFNPSNFNTPDVPIIPGTSPGQVTNPSDLAIVSKPIKLVVVDELGGAAATGTTNSIDIYQADGVTISEADLDLSAGTVTTGVSYTSDTQIWISYYYDTTIDEHYKVKVTVPRLSQADAESLTTNQITVKAPNEIAATDLLSIGGTTYADAADLNTTATTSGSITYAWSITTDNTGYKSFYDPIYQIDMKPILWVTMTGSGYATVPLTGFDGVFESASTKYYYHVLNDNEISKYKVGNQYLISGNGAFTFNFDATAYSLNATVLNCYVELYTNSDYMRTYNDYGPYDFALCESTLELFDQTA